MDSVVTLVYWQNVKHFAWMYAPANNPTLEIYVFFKYESHAVRASIPCFLLPSSGLWRCRLGGQRRVDGGDVLDGCGGVQAAMDVPEAGRL